MDLKQQEEIQKHFERMYTYGQKPWRYHPPEKSLSVFFQKLKENAPTGKGKAKILDIGCGDGWITLSLASEGHEAWGIDSSQTAIDEAKMSAKNLKVAGTIHFEVGDALNLHHDSNFFDGLVDRGLFHHILPANRTLYLKNIEKVLKKGALVYLSTFSPHNPEGIGHRFTKEKIGEIFKDNFEVIYYDEDPLPTKAPAHLLHFILKKTK